MKSHGKLRRPTNVRIPRAFLSLPVLTTALALIALILHFPGQAPTDAIIQLQDGMSGIYDSNQPPVMSYMMGKLSLNGMLAFQLTLFSISVLLLFELTPGRSVKKLIALVFLFFFPVSLLYMGTLLKDVLFAYLAILGLLILPANRQFFWLKLFISAFLVGLAVSVRQQGLIVVPFALMCLFFATRWVFRRILPWHIAAVWVIGLIFFAGTFKVIVNISGDTTRNLAFKGPLYQLELYDLAGIASQNQNIELPALQKVCKEIPANHRPTRDRIMDVFACYKPDRQDWMDQRNRQVKVYFPLEALQKDWCKNIMEHPFSYVTHRLNVFSWIIGLHDITKCLPFAMGISANPPEMVAEVGIKPGLTKRAELLRNLGERTMFLFRPVWYLIISVVVTAFLVWDGWREHFLMFAIQLSGLAYAVSYFFIGIAFDFRYTFYSTLVGLFGLAYIFVCGRKKAAKPRRLASMSDRKKKA